MNAAPTPTPTLCFASLPLGPLKAPEHPTANAQAQVPRAWERPGPDYQPSVDVMHPDRWLQGQ